MKKVLFQIAFLCGAAACQPTIPTSKSAKTVQTLHLPQVDTHNYWFQGKAEIAVYDVAQERYGELRHAQQVMVFVSEDFSKGRQVKLDNPAAADANDRQPVLKLNALRRFNTGMYDYSMMLSVFQPIAASPKNALKTTLSVQDWCGQIFQQINQTDAGLFRARLFSYFESEGDTDEQFGADFLEDEIWTLLRLHPQVFKNGNAQCLPALFYQRLRHQPLQALPAQFTVEEHGEKSVLLLRYTTLDRSLRIEFETAAPHRIVSWEETASGLIISRGSLRNILVSDYWTKNSQQYDALRDSLGLHFFE